MKTYEIHCCLDGSVTVFITAETEEKALEQAFIEAGNNCPAGFQVGVTEVGEEFTDEEYTQRVLRQGHFDNN